LSDPITALSASAVALINVVIKILPQSPISGILNDIRLTQMTKELTREQASAMTVNERLYLAGLFDKFYEAVDKEDRASIALMLDQVYLPTNPEYVEQIITAQKLPPRYWHRSPYRSA
jgi:hypothetical protein